MSLETPEPFLTVAWGTPIDIGLLLTHPTDEPDDLLTIGWQPKLGTTFLPYDPAETKPARTAS